MTKAESEYVSLCVEGGCIICGQPAQWHHCRGGSITREFGIVGGAGRSPHMRGLALCHRHHQGAEGIHTLGCEVWEAWYGTQIELMADLHRRFGEPPAEPGRKSRNRRPSKIVPRNAA